MLHRLTPCGRAHQLIPKPDYALRTKESKETDQKNPRTQANLGQRRFLRFKAASIRSQQRAYCRTIWPRFPWRAREGQPDVSPSILHFFQNWETPENRGNPGQTDILNFRQTDCQSAHRYARLPMPYPQNFHRLRVQRRNSTRYSPIRDGTEGQPDMSPSIFHFSAQCNQQARTKRDGPLRPLRRNYRKSRFPADMQVTWLGCRERCRRPSDQRLLLPPIIALRIIASFFAICGSSASTISIRRSPTRISTSP